MENLNKIKVSAGAVLGQAIVLTFAIPFVCFAGYLMTRHMDSTALWILGIILVILSVFVWNAFLFADIYLLDGVIVMEKIIGTKKRPITDYKSIESGIRLFSYYIEFEDGQKVYFKLKPGDMLKRVVKTDTEVLDTIREIFETKKKQFTAQPHQGGQ